MNNSSSNHFIEHDVARLIWAIYSPLLLCFGIVGNALSFVALSRPILRMRVSSLYLRALCVVDTGALVFGLLPIWIIHLANYDVTVQHDVICKLRNFLFYAFSDSSVWLICAFTVDRFIAVVFPFKKRSLCTRKHACIAIIAVVLLSIGKNVETVITRSVMIGEYNISKCRTPDPEHAFYDTYVRPWLVFTAVTAFPCFLLLTCNICIVRALRATELTRREICGEGKASHQLASMTRMCLTVSFTFLLLVSPSIVLLIGRPYWTLTPIARARYGVARAVGNLCQYSNNAANFMLYLGAGRVFRHEIKTICPCFKICKRNRSPVDEIVVGRELTSNALHTAHISAHACLATEVTSLINKRLSSV